MNPTKEEVKQARIDAGLTQRRAADMLYVTETTWKSWEYGTNKMSQANWELFNIKQGN